MDKKKRIQVSLILSAIVVVIVSAPGFAATSWTDDFSAWSFVAGPSGAIPGPDSHNVLNADNSDSLKWNLIANTGGVHSDQYVYTHTETIPAIEFDYRFKNDGNNFVPTLIKILENVVALTTAPGIIILLEISVFKGY